MCVGGGGVKEGEGERECGGGGRRKGSACEKEGECVAGGGGGGERKNEKIDYMPLVLYS